MQSNESVRALGNNLDRCKQICEKTALMCSHASHTESYEWIKEHLKVVGRPSPSQFGIPQARNPFTTIFIRSLCMSVSAGGRNAATLVAGHRILVWSIMIKIAFKENSASSNLKLANVRKGSDSA